MRNKIQTLEVNDDSTRQLKSVANMYHVFLHVLLQPSEPRLMTSSSKNVSHLTLIITYKPISPTELELLVTKAILRSFL